MIAASSLGAAQSARITIDMGPPPQIRPARHTPQRADAPTTTPPAAPHRCGQQLLQLLQLVLIQRAHAVAHELADGLLHLGREQQEGRRHWGVVAQARGVAQAGVGQSGYLRGSRGSMPGC